MDEVLEYISLNYIWFLIGAIIIVLAIIGHYAEKSNFGQGKNKNNPLPKEKDKEPELEQENLKDLINKNDKDENVDKLETKNIQEIFSENSLEDAQNDISVEGESNLDNSTQEQNLDQLQSETDKSSNSDETDINYVDELTDDLFNPIESEQTNSNDEEKNETYDSNNIEKSNDLTENSDSTKTREDEFKDFDKEFDMVVPKKDIMNEGILEDIEDLSLDNTQVFNKEDIPDLDNIDLPEIRDTNFSENDIWKF